MKIWVALYAMIWLVFVEFMLVLTPASDPRPLVYAHVAIGVAIVVLANYNLVRLRGSEAPARLKRIAKATLSFAALQVPLGLLLAFGIGAGVEIPFTGITITGVIAFLHVVNSFAIITQAASVATAYDMWEEKEFAPGVEGSVPST